MLGETKSEPRARKKISKRALRNHLKILRISACSQRRTCVVAVRISITSGIDSLSEENFTLSHTCERDYHAVWSSANAMRVLEIAVHNI